MNETAAFPDWVLVAGMVVAAALAAGAVLGRTVRGRAWAMLGALVLTPVLLVAEIWDSPQIESVRERGVLAVGAAAVGLAAVGALAWLFARRPGLLGVLALAALPFRIPVQAGGSTANLLVPLYVVIGAGALAWLVPRLAARYQGEPAERSGALEWVLMGGIVLYALQAIYADDSAKALEQVVFFYVPFALLFALLRGLEWTPRRLAWGGGVLVALALVFTAIGFWEFQTRSLLLNPKVIASNQVEEYFRVNSLFFDPNIYGRFLALVMIGLASVLLWAKRPRNLAWTIAALVVLWGGLITTLSQSSFAALLLGLFVLAWLRFGGKVVLVPALAAVGARGRARVRVPGRAAARVQRALARPGDVGSRGPDARRAGARARAAAGRLGLGQLPGRVPPPRALVGPRGDGGLAHDPDHGRRRAGRDRPGRVRGAARARVPAAAARRARRPGPRGDRGRVRRARAPHVALRRVPRGPGDLDPARARHGARGRARRPSRGGRRRGDVDERAPPRAGRRSALSPVNGSRFARPVERAAAVLAVAVAVLVWAITRTYPNYDSYFHLVWGRELLDGVAPSFEAYAAPTQHPLYVALGAVLGLVFGESADRALVLVCLLSHAALVFGAYRLGAAVFGRWSGALGALFVAASASFLLYAARGYVDAPFLALVVWAGVFEAEQRGPTASARAADPRRASCGPRRGCCRGLWWL